MILSPFVGEDRAPLHRLEPRTLSTDMEPRELGARLRFRQRTTL